MALCDSLIKAAIGVDCENAATKGVEANGVIINRQDIDFTATALDATRKNIIKTLALKTGKKGYDVYCPGATPYTGAKTTMEKGTYKNKFTNEIPLVILDNGPDVCEDVIEGLADGEFVVLLKNKHRGTDGRSTYQMYGYFQGLRAESLESDKYSEETDGGWKAVLKETGAPKAAMFYFNTDAKTTATQLATLTANPAP